MMTGCMEALIGITVALTMNFTPATIPDSSIDGGNIEHVQVLEWGTSEIYADEDIESAIRTVEDYFHKEFGGCTLAEMQYAGDGSADEFEEWANAHHADEAIILYSSFDTDSSGGACFKPNSTYDGYSWLLVRNKGEDWKCVTRG